MSFPPGSLRSRDLLLALLLVAAVAAFRRPLAAVFASSISVDQYSHILLVLPVSLALLYLERTRIFAAVAYSKPGGLFLLLFAAAAVMARRYTAGLSPNDFFAVSLFFFAGICVSAFLFCYGIRAFRVASFPLLFLFLMVPVPDALLVRGIGLLQNGSAGATAFLFKLAGIPFSRDGVLLLLPKATIEIATECSGIRSSLVLFLTSLILGHLFLHSAWSKTALALAVIPLTIAKNGLRIFVLSMLGMYMDASFLSGGLHRKGGVLFFGLAVACLLVLIRLLQRLERRRADAPPSPVGHNAPLKQSF